MGDIETFISNVNFGTGCWSGDFHYTNDNKYSGTNANVCAKTGSNSGFADNFCVMVNSNNG